MLEEAIDREHDIHFAGTIVSEFQVTEPMIKTFSLGRMVKILSIFDLIFAFVFSDEKGEEMQLLQRNKVFPNGKFIISITQEFDRLHFGFWVNDEVERCKT